MELTDEQINKVEKKLTKYFNKGKCPICKNDTWILSQHTFKIHELNGERLMPLIVLICDKCGCTSLFNAIKLKIIEGDEKERKSKKKKSIWKRLRGKKK